jgi:protein-S-isoprenylcysteine O-methyltransferase Ste14
MGAIAVSDVNLVEQAERLSKRRARICAVLAVMFLGLQAVYLSNGALHESTRISHFKIGAWAVNALVLLLLLATGGNLLRGRAIKNLLNDETTRAHRAVAIAWGFWTMIVTGFGLYIVQQFEAVTTREALHMLITFGTAVPLLVFSYLERRAYRDA